MERFTLSLLLLAGLLWLWSPIDATDINTWLIEQVASLIGIGVLIWLSRSVQFSRLSQISLFTLFCIHTIGTHYTYSLTPYEQFLSFVLGSSPNDWFGWERNHYDRFVHFCYGLLLARPIAETLAQHLRQSSGLRAFLGFNLILSSSAFYELMEWSAAVVFGGDVGTAYLGMQGDIWDTQIDIALAAAGWLVAHGGLGIHHVGRSWLVRQ